jgi:glycosyltransferase involved in cell wall biosynthesis
VVPVYNEHDSIAACLLRLDAALAGEEHEILVCYDFDEDTTLAAIAAMNDRPASVHLVKNTIGRGAANALRAGFRAAQGDVIVTTMADLSDPPELIPRMAEHMRQGGYAVVAGSRYMRGGSQTGGPLLKRTMSRVAGLGLHWLTGVGTHDATNNFRAYSRSFLDSAGVESTTGFEIAIELTVKAQALGLRVGEVPSSWTDRAAGQSRFRLWSWLPNYLRWWLRAAREPMIVWTAWAVMLAMAIAFVAEYAARIPFWDDLELLRLWLPTTERTLQSLWALHNEHRIPLPRAVEVGLLHLTGDFRSLMYFEVAIYALLSAAMILVARRLRGRTSWTDAFFPLVWLHTGNCENLLMGFQVSLALPTAFVCTLMLLVVTRPRGLSLREAIVCGVLLLAMPLCGGPGITQTPPFLGAIALLGVLALRGRAPGSRTANWALVCGGAATVVLIGLYLIGFEYPPNSTHTNDPVDIVSVAVRFLAMSIGQAGREWFPWSMIGVLAVLAWATWACARRLRVPVERLRAAGILVSLSATCILALGIGHGRGGSGDYGAGFAVRYIGLPAPLLCAVYFTALLYGGLFTSAIVRGACVLALAAAVVLVEIPAGNGYGEIRQRTEQELRERILSGESVASVFQQMGERTYPDWGSFSYLFGWMAKSSITPFDEASPEIRQHWAKHADVVDTSIDVEHNAWIERVSRLPIGRIEAKEGLLAGRHIADDLDAVAVPPHSAIRIPFDEAQSHIIGKYGVLPAAYATTGCDSARFTVSLLEPGGRREILLERVLDPTRAPEDRGPQALDLRLPEHSHGEIVLRLAPGTGETKHLAWGYWADVKIE